LKYKTSLQISTFVYTENAPSIHLYQH